MKKYVGVGYVAECVEESREREKEMVCFGMRVDEFQKLDLLVCSGEEEKYKEKSKVKIGRSKEYVCRCVEEKKR